MKKIIIILIVGIAIVIVASAAYYLFTDNKSGDATTAINLPSNNVSTSSPIRIGKASEIFKDLPTGDTLAIGTPHGTVTVKNFYASDPSVNDGGDIVIKETANYVIVYDPTDGSFWLGIMGTPFATWQQTAEQDLLQTLAINKADGCKLKATSGIIYKPGDPNDGKSFPLSLCAGTVIQ